MNTATDTNGTTPNTPPHTDGAEPPHTPPHTDGETPRKQMRSVVRAEKAFKAKQQEVSDMLAEIDTQKTHLDIRAEVWTEALQILNRTGSEDDDE